MMSPLKQLKALEAKLDKLLKLKGASSTYIKKFSGLIGQAVKELSLNPSNSIPFDSLKTIELKVKILIKKIISEVISKKKELEDAIEHEENRTKLEAALAAKVNAAREDLKKLVKGIEDFFKKFKEAYNKAIENLKKQMNEANAEIWKDIGRLGEEIKGLVAKYHLPSSSLVKKDIEEFAETLEKSSSQKDKDFGVNEQNFIEKTLDEFVNTINKHIEEDKNSLKLTHEQADALKQEIGTIQKKFRASLKNKLENKTELQAEFERKSNELDNLQKKHDELEKEVKEHEGLLNQVKSQPANGETLKQAIELAKKQGIEPQNSGPSKRPGK